MATRQINARVSRSGSFRQTENALLTYTANYAGLHTSAISTSAWSVENGSGLTIGSEANGDHSATATFNGDVGHYRITNKVTLADGNVDETFFDLEIEDNSLSGSADYA